MKNTSLISSQLIFSFILINKFQVHALAEALPVASTGWQHFSSSTVTNLLKLNYNNNSSISHNICRAVIFFSIFLPCHRIGVFFVITNFLLPHRRACDTVLRVPLHVPVSVCGAGALSATRPHTHRSGDLHAPATPCSARLHATPASQG